MSEKTKSIIIKFENGNEQIVGDIIKVTGLVNARYFIPIIDTLNLEANPRSAKTGSVTDAIQESIEKNTALFPFMTKGVLLASSNYKRLERNRFEITPMNDEIEGILDGGHNTLAIGLYILRQTLEFHGETLSKGSKTWDDFKMLWHSSRKLIEAYLFAVKKGDTKNGIDFLVPVELLIPRDLNETACLLSFSNNLLDVCEARNNNAELQLSAKANQKGHFVYLRNELENHNIAVANRIEWKTNDGGEVKVQDIIALAWISLNLIDPVSDSSNSDKKIEHIAPNKIYSGKGACLKQFEKLMNSPDVTAESDETYKDSLINEQVKSALSIAVELPELYDYIYENFPTLYNNAGGRFLGITAAKKLNEKRKSKKTPFSGKSIDVITPEGFIAPLVYGLQALMMKKNVNGQEIIVWKQAPLPFLISNLGKIVSDYIEIFSVCDYDPQKVGKAPVSYNTALRAYQMAVAGLL